MSERKHSHYFKSVEGLKDSDVYRVLAVRRLGVAQNFQDITRDIQEAIDTLKRWQEMRAEEAPAQGASQ